MKLYWQTALYEGATHWRWLIPKYIVSFSCKYKLLVNPSYKLRQQVIVLLIVQAIKAWYIQLHTPDTFPSLLVLVQSSEHSGLD